MISAIAWIPRGVAKAVPGDAEYTEAELAEAHEAAEGADGSDDDNEQSEASMDTDTEDSEEEEIAQIAKAKAFAAALKKDRPASHAGPAIPTDDIDAAMAELDMDHYDSEAEEGEGVTGVFGNTNPGMAYYANNDHDPYIKLAASAEVDSEAEDFELTSDDVLLLAARNQDDVSHLEVWVYEEADSSSPSNLYVHHDILIPAFPLCLAWLDCSPSGRQEAGNFLAVGTMGPGIDIWDLDILDSVEPAAILGGEAHPPAAMGAADPASDEQQPASSSKKRASKTSKRKKAEQALKENSHEDAVLSLSWNAEYRNVLASGSADKAVKVWDVATGACQATLRWHEDKVQAVAWNPADAPVLLSGGFDHRVVLGDARAPSDSLRWETSADVEALAWDPHTPTRFLVSSEDGIVAAFDARSGAGAKPLFRLAAHSKPACCLSFNPAAPGLLATASTDKKVKLWDVSAAPSLVTSQKLNIGAVFSAAFCPERPALFAAAGAKGEVRVWDIMSSPAVAAKYSRTLASQVPTSG